MPRRPRVPEALRHGPFAQAVAREHGVTPTMLGGPAWVRVHPRVWVHRDHPMSDLDWITAATLAMPGRAHLSHASRLQALGLTIADLLPIRFTVRGDLHLDLAGIFLHRTVALPPLDDVGVTPAAAFIQMCAEGRLIDVVVAGDWLLANEHTTIMAIDQLARLQDWRPGAAQARRVLRRLDPRSASPKESELRCLVIACGLPDPAVNAPVHDAQGRQLAIVDLLIARWGLALEFEGRQHAFDTQQFNSDIARYARLRQAGLEYVQVTQEMLRQPRALMRVVHAALVRRGYDGPPPVFGAHGSTSSNRSPFRRGADRASRCEPSSRRR